MNKFKGKADKRMRYILCFILITFAIIPFSYAKETVRIADSSLTAKDSIANFIPDSTTLCLLDGEIIPYKTLIKLYVDKKVLGRYIEPKNAILIFGEKGRYGVMECITYSDN